MQNKCSYKNKAYFSHILNHDFHSLLVATCAELCGDQGLAQLLLAGHTDRLAVVEGSLSTTRRELLVQDGIIHDSHLGHFVHPQADGHTRVREAVHKVHGAVHRINNPGGLIAQQLLLALACLFLADESGGDMEDQWRVIMGKDSAINAALYLLVVRELGRQSVD